MAQRRGRRSAGNEVAALAQRLSDDLLLLEEDCFAAIGKEFDTGVDDAAAVFAAAWRRAQGDVAVLAGDRTFADRIAAVHGLTLAASRPHVAGLAGRVRDLALESIEKELAVCEETLAKKYAGISVEAATAAWERSEDLVTQRLAVYEQEVQAGQVVFVTQMQQQVGLARLYAEDQDRLARRLFNPEPNSLRGNGGRGVWWRASSGLNRAAREVSIRLASTCRLAAMSEFNTAGERRA